MAPRSDSRLLASGSPADFEAFYLRHVAVVTAFATRRTGRTDVALDVVAETFATALAKRSQYRARRGPAIAWLLTIARNLIIDQARQGIVASRAQERLGMERPTADDAELRAIDEHTSFSIDEALTRLPPEQRDAVRQRVLEDAPYVEIAARAGCTEQVVRQRVRRGLKALRQTLPEAWPR